MEEARCKKLSQRSKGGGTKRYNCQSMSLLEGSDGWLEWSEGWLEGSEGQPAGSEGQLAGCKGHPEGGRTNRQTDGQTEFLPILQDFVPCLGRCPKS